MVEPQNMIAIVITGIKTKALKMIHQQITRNEIVIIKAHKINRMKK